MRAVVGSVNSSEPISLSEAAHIVSRFASSVSSAGVRHEVSAYFNRVSAAFYELVLFHRDARDELKRNPGNGVLDGDGREEKGKSKKSRNNEGDDGNPEEAEVDGKENLELAEEGKKKKKKKDRKSKKNRDRQESKIEVGGVRENGVLDVDSDGDGRKKKKSDSKKEKKKKKKRDREDSEKGVEEGGGSEIHDRKKKRRKNKESNEY